MTSIYGWALVREFPGRRLDVRAAGGNAGRVTVLEAKVKQAIKHGKEFLRLSGQPCRRLQLTARTAMKVTVTTIVVKETVMP